MNKKGFTLVELLAVIVVLGIIISIAVPTAMNLINNSKKKAFVYDAKAYIDSARYTVLSENGKKTFFKLDELSVKNKKKSYKGVVYAKKDESGHYKYSIFIYDESSNNVLGRTYFDKIGLLSEDELSISKIEKFDSERFGTELLENLNNPYEIKMISKDNKTTTITVKKDGSIEESVNDIVFGGLIYLKYTYNNKTSCKYYRAINGDDNEISVLDWNEYTNTFNEIKANLLSQKKQYSQNFGIPESDLYVRLLTVNDLYYYLDYERNGLTQKLLTSNKDKIAELFNPPSPETFYYSEWKSSTFPRFISLGTYGDDDYCNADGTYKETEINEKVCYAFSLKEVYHGGKLDGPAKIVNVANNSYLTFNNIISIKNYKEHVYEDKKCLNKYFNEV